MHLASHACISSRPLRERSFSPGDQSRFAAYSGDSNPIHVAPHLAGRTHTGEMVVHGAHLALWLLEEIARHPFLNGLACLSVRFLKPCHVGDVVAAEIVCLENGVVSARALVEGVPIAEMELLPALSEPFSYADNPLDPPAQPRCPETIEMQSGEVGLTHARSEAEKLFPHVTRRLGDGVPALIAALSQLVGMHCPGRYSLLSGFSLRFASAGLPFPGRLAYRVARWDQRFHLVTMAVECGDGVEGTVTAFRRQDKIHQPAMRVIKECIRGKPYLGHDVLIVGGSRGLGETAAKLLAAGGALVTITYRFAKGEAERVAAEIEDGGGDCAVLKFDVTQPPAPQLAALTPKSALLYLATPSIRVRRLKWFDGPLLASFEEYYVRGFAELCDCVAAWDRPVRILYPSTSALDEFAKDMLEYAIAKSAGEELCRRIPGLYPKLSIVTPRLPRLATDQNAGFLPHLNKPVLEVLDPILRKMLGADDAKGRLYRHDEHPQACA